MDPTVQNRIRQMAESGLTAEELLQQLHLEAEQTLIQQADEEERKRRGVAPDKQDDREEIPNEIRLISQALAYREADMSDCDGIHSLLNRAYRPEVDGPEAFRTGEPVSRESIEYYLNDPSYQWIVVEAPKGHGVIADGDILGVCCFSTDGVSRRNGIVEGNVGSIRFLALLPRFQGLCIGQRLLSKVEDRIFSKWKCLRVVLNVSSSRTSMLEWAQKRGYEPTRDLPYPFQQLGHTQISDIQQNEEVFLVQCIKNATAVPRQDLLTENISCAQLPPPQPSKKITLPPHWRVSPDIVSISNDNSTSNCDELGVD